MSLNLTLRYRGLDKYNFPIFTCRADSDAEQPAFAKALTMHNKIGSFNYGTHNPVYYSESHQYCNITFRPIPSEVFDSTKLKYNTLYKIDFSVHVKEIKGKKHMNIYADGIELIGEAKEERGECVSFD